MGRKEARSTRLYRRPGTPLHPFAGRWAQLHAEVRQAVMVSHLFFSPRICPTMRLQMPMPIICREVVSPMAVPTVDWLTTRGMVGHMLA